MIFVCNECCAKQCSGGICKRCGCMDLEADESYDYGEPGSDPVYPEVCEEDWPGEPDEVDDPKQEGKD